MTPKTDNTKIVLASASSSRAMLLQNAGVTVDVCPADVDESPVKDSLSSDGKTALDAAQALAELKAVTVSRRTPDALVIGADQILDLDGLWFDKPEDMTGAHNYLQYLRGKTHYLATAVAVAQNGTCIWQHQDRPALTMRSFSDAFLQAYLADVGDAILSSVGAYHLEGRGVHLFNKIEGNFFSILGLPLLPLLAFLRDRGALMS